MQQTDLFDSVKKAQNIIDVRFKYGAAKRGALFLEVGRNAIHDRLAVPSFLLFAPDGPGKVSVKVEGKWLEIHDHALDQLCSKASPSLPIRFVDNLRAKKDVWADGLVCTNLNKLYGNAKPESYLLRSVNDVLRGFLSNRYALHLSTDPLLHRFDSYAIELGAKPIGATWSDVRVNLEVALPFVYQPFADQHLLIGLSFFNSDYGAGTFTVSPSILDIDRNYSMVVPTDSLESIKKIHLGPLLTENDLNRVTSDRALRVDYNVGRMRMTMARNLSKTYCEAVCRAVAKARDTETTWGAIKKKLFGSLLKEELAELEKSLKERNARLPRIELDADGLPIPTNWWAASAVAQLADTMTDPDRKIDLQHTAGQFISIKE